MQNEILFLSQTLNSELIARRLNLSLNYVENILIDNYYKSKFIISKEDLKLAAKLIYESNSSSIAAKFNLTVTTLHRYFDICKLYYPKVNVLNNNTTNINIADIILDYQSGLSLESLERKYQISRKLISKKFKELSISTNKVTFSDYLFDKIDNDEKAYWLGFFYADAGLSYRSNSLEVSLKLSDTEHLVKLHTFFKAKRDIRLQYKGIQRCRLTLISKHFKEQLIKLGCTPRKSLILEFPTKEQVPELFIKSFIRGYFDGDGCISYAFRNKKKKTITPRLSLLGTKNFLEGCMQYLPKVKTKLANKGGSEKCLEVSWNKEDSCKILDYLYNDSTIYLTRKYERYKIFKENNFAVLLSDFQNNDRAISVKSKQYINQYFNIDLDQLLQDNTEIN